MVTKNRSRELSPSVRLLVSECKLNCHWLVNIWSLSGSKIVKNRQQENFMKRTSGNYLQISSAPIRFYLASLKRGPWQIISQIMLWWIIFQGLYLNFHNWRIRWPPVHVHIYWPALVLCPSGLLSRRTSYLGHSHDASQPLPLPLLGLHHHYCWAWGWSQGCCRSLSLRLRRIRIRIRVWSRRLLRSRVA